MNIFTKKVIGVAVALSLVVPAGAQAAGLTEVQINSVIGLLQSFNVDQKTIDTVQEVLTHTAKPEAMKESRISSTTPQRLLPPGLADKAACIALNRNLGLGSRGDDVKKLQEMLAEDPEAEFQATPTGFFGPMTAKAVMLFQLRKGIASTTTGMVGPLTRGFFERRCGKGLEIKDNESDKKMREATTTSATASTTKTGEGSDH